MPLPDPGGLVPGVVELVGEGPLGDELHGVERPAVAVDAQDVDRDDAGMLQSRGDDRLAPDEALPRTGVSQEWERLLSGDLDALEGAVCGDTDHAAALRSMSPMSVLITQKERSALLRRARGQT